MMIGAVFGGLTGILGVLVGVAAMLWGLGVFECMGEGKSTPPTALE